MSFRHFYFFFACVGTMAAVGLMGFATPVIADETEWQANWRFEADFEDNQPNVMLTVFAWEIVDGVPQPVPPETRDLTCSVSPNVVLANDAASFIGKGGIHCTVPSIHQIVFEMTGGHYDLPDECICKTGASAWAALTFTQNEGDLHFSNPLFHLTDLEWSVPIQAGGGLRPSMNMTVDTAVAQSSLFSVGTGGSSLTAFFDAQKVGEEKYHYMPFFNANALPLKAAPVLIQQNLLISNKQSVLYIGYSPVTKESLRGVLTDLIVDPGCFGNGGQ